MSLPSGYLPREGDVLVIHAVAKYTVDPGDDQVHLVLPGRYSAVTVDLTEVEGLHCRKWTDNESVMWGQQPATVIATDDDYVWIKLGDGARQIVKANDLEPAPEPVAQVPSPVTVGDQITVEKPLASDDDEIEF